MHKVFPDMNSAREGEEALAPRRRPQWLYWAAGGLLLVLFIWFLVARASSLGDDMVENELPAITVMVPGLQPVRSSIWATGSIAARHDMPVGVQGEGGKVVALRAEAGQNVQRGQILAELDSSVQQAQLAQLRANVEQANADARLAQAELDRASQLIERGFISRADIERRTATRDSARARMALAKAQVREMQARIAQFTLRAPEGGIILQRHIEAGQMVSPMSGPAFNIAAGAELEMRALVAEQDMPRLRVGQEATVIPLGADAGAVGRVWLLEPAIDPATRQGVARILLPTTPELRAGGFANARIDSAPTSRPTVPQSAVITASAGSHVMIVNAEGIVEQRRVEVGEMAEEGAVITAGLDGTEQVVVLAAAFLRPGETVRPVAADNAPAPAQAD